MDNPILAPRGARRYAIATDVADLELGITGGDPFVFTEGPVHQTRRQPHGAVPLRHHVDVGDLGEPVTRPALNDPFGVAGGSPAALEYEHLAWSSATEGPSDNYDKPTSESPMMRDGVTYRSEWHETHGKFGPNGSLAAQWGRTPNYPKGEGKTMASQTTGRT
jgi:hypothetical protein